MNNRRAKLAAGATVLGLGALGGVALGTNQGIPAATQQATGGSAPIVTGASGAAATPVSQTIAVHRNSSTHPPIVTRASGGLAPLRLEVDD